MDLKFLTKHVALLLALLIIAPAAIAGYPLPGSDKQAPVVCTDCVGLNFGGQPNKGKPTWPYSAPIVKHVGRLVDSSATKDVQNIGIRTLRAHGIRLQSGPSPSRLYVKIGGAIGVYSLDRFFTTALPGGMKPVTAVASGVGVSRTKFNSPNEELTVWDAHVYAENYGSSWPVTPDDKQDVLLDHDADDRGFLYAAYSVWGWGIVQDSGETGGALLPVISTVGEGASTIVVVKVGSSYYAAVGDQGPAHKMFNVTNPGAPSPMGQRSFGIVAWAKSDAASRIAIIDDAKQLRIYDYQSFATGGAPLVGPVSVSGGYADVNIDETGVVWALTGRDSYDAAVQRYAPSGSSYTSSTLPVGETFKGVRITSGAGFLAVAGGGLAGNDLILFKIEGANIRRLDLKNFFNKYYHHAPSGYANPPTDFSYITHCRGLALIKRAGKLYLMYNVHGMGDVYEIEAGDSIGASMRTTNFGTANPHSKATDVGPFPGDVVKFVATSSNPSVAYEVSWEFGNPESARNLSQTSTGADTSHQFVGYTTAGQVTAPKTVTATAVNDATLTDKVTVNLKLPTPRIGISGTNTVITAAGASPLTLVLGESFTDASDGSVESHVANWSIDGAVPVKALPSTVMPSGAIGPHTVNLTTSYGRYDTALNMETGAYSVAVANVPYVVRPFVFDIAAAKSGANAIFTGSDVRFTTNTQVVVSPTWTVTWTLTNGAAVIQSQTGSAAFGTIPAFAVPTSAVPTGSVVTLEAALPTSGLAAPPEYATFSRTLSLSKPDPVITKTGCANVGTPPCTLTASSASGSSMDGWVFSWSLVKDGQTVATGAGNPYTPNITAPGNYTVNLSAVKGIFDGAAHADMVVQGALCGPPPTVDQLAISAACGACKVGDTVTFRASMFGYSRQDCDVFTWNFGDNTPSVVGTTATHTYASAGTYTARLTVSNNSGHGSTTVSREVPITSGSNPPPPPPDDNCTRALGVGITYSGNKGCGPGIPCKVGERVNFTGTKNNGNDLLSSACDTATWEFGDGGSGSGRSTNRTYNNPGSYTVTLRVTGPGGNASPASVIIPVVNSNGTGACSGAATADNLVPSFKGGESNCSNLNDALCRRGESIQFDLKTFDYTLQACDKFEWNFGDGGTSTLKNPTHAFTGSAAAYNVTVRVYNETNPTGVTVPIEVPFDNAPIQPQPAISVSGPRSAGKGGVVTFTATSDIPATNWRWNFGDGTGVDTSQAGVVGTSSTITHVFDRVSNAQGFSVTVTAKNAQDTTDRSAASAVAQVVVTETPVYRFLLPAVIHAGGQNGSAWRTDVQVYYGAPSPSAEPLVMNAEFQGATTELLINQSTFIYEDFMRQLVSTDAQGPVIITTQTKYKPQIWTRTYNVDASGRTFGQFIPAISLDGPTGSAIDGSADPVKYYLAGLRENTRYRTNLGFINPTTTDVIANVVAYDDLRLPVGTPFTVSIAPFQLVQINGLSTKIANLPNRPISLEISVPAGKWIVAYASFIDGLSNDPAYIPAVSDAELASNAYATGVTPGVGHVGDWRSDVTIYNPDAAAVRFDLEYRDADGHVRGEAKDLVLGSGQFKSYEDLLKVAGLWTTAPPDGLGMLRLRTTTPVARYPMSFSRTYNDKGSGGTFGQGIAGFGAANANVKPGKAAIIPGVRSDANYKTNIGLSNVTANAANVVVRLLDPNTGAVSREIAVSLAAYQSVVGAFDFGGLERGTFKVEVTGGAGEVWAFASIINQGNDPEYVPGIPLE